MFSTLSNGLSCTFFRPRKPTDADEFKKPGPSVLPYQKKPPTGPIELGTVFKDMKRERENLGRFTPQRDFPVFRTVIVHCLRVDLFVFLSEFDFF
jgi:hypothetical protein